MYIMDDVVTHSVLAIVDHAMEDKWYVGLCMKTLLHIHMVRKHLGGWWCCLTFHDHLSCRQHPACENF